MTAVPRFPSVVFLAFAGLQMAACSGPSYAGRISVEKPVYSRSKDVAVTISVPKGSVGTHLRIQRMTSQGWKEVATFNPKLECPVMKERQGGGYTFVTQRSPMCRQVEGKWEVIWKETTGKQCGGFLAVLPGKYRICVALFARRCQVWKGVYGFERPRGASTFICTAPFLIK